MQPVPNTTDGNNVVDDGGRETRHHLGHLVVIGSRVGCRISVWSCPRSLVGLLIPPWCRSVAYSCHSSKCAHFTSPGPVVVGSYRHFSFGDSSHPLPWPLLDLIEAWVIGRLRNICPFITSNQISCLTIDYSHPWPEVCCNFICKIRFVSIPTSNCGRIAAMQMQLRLDDIIRKCLCPIMLTVLI